MSNQTALAVPFPILYPLLQCPVLSLLQEEGDQTGSGEDDCGRSKHAGTGECGVAGGRIGVVGGARSASSSAPRRKNSGSSLGEVLVCLESARGVGGGPGGHVVSKIVRI